MIPWAKDYNYLGRNLVLEQIKNGRTLAAKFDSKELKFHTPNVVVVFSNERPEEDQLSTDISNKK